MSRWMGIELRHLAALRAVIEEGSFNRAALRLGYTQSAISQQISSLERILGHRLLNRQIGSNKISLTPAGERFLAHAERLLEGLLAAETDLATLDRPPAESLAVGVYQSVGVRVLPEVLAQFASAWPDVRVELTESCSDDELLDHLRRGQLQLAFATAPLQGGGFEYVEMLSDPIVLVVHADSPLVTKPFAGPADLADLRLIGYRQSKNIGVVSDYLRVHRIAPHFVHAADENGLIQGLVRSGAGAALMPRLAVDERDRGISMLELEPSGIARTIVLAWHRDRGRSLAARAFVDLAQRVCARVAAELAADARQAAP
jgi:DNA-binding transcriptional LysR family regulator